MGAALLQKKFTVDYLTKKQKVNNGEVPQYYVTGSHEGIVSEEVFEFARYEMARRKGLRNPYSSVGPFASRIVCAECGGIYGSKVWHSNSKYRQTVWRCNGKYKSRNGEAACHTPHLTEEQIKKAFVGAFNSCLDDKEEIIAGCRSAAEALCDTEALERQISKLAEECEVTAELIRKWVEEGAHSAIRPDTFNERYNELAGRYEASKKQLDEKEEEKTKRAVKKEQILRFLETLSASEDLITEFDEGLWNTMVESMAVYSYDKVIFAFRDGTTVKWKIEQ